MSLSPYEIAQHENGVKELPGDENNPRILEYHQATTLKADDEGVPWCSAFMCWCIDEAIKNGWQGTPSTKRANARSYLNWGVSVKKDPLPGDICVFSRGNSKSEGHVTFFVKYSSDKKSIICFGGNQGDAVCYSYYLTAKLLDIRRSAS